MEKWIALGVVVVVLLYAVALYNGLVAGRNRVRNAWAQIDVQLKRRHDLIPNLVEAVKGYMAHERGIFDEIAKARAQAMAAGANVPARAAAENQLTRSVNSLMALAEAVPQLRANENMMSFQEELSSTENRIAFARQFYNDAVLDYNTRIATVPASFVAGPFGFQAEQLFAGDAADREPVAVKF
jgi:LemA protein